MATSTTRGKYAVFPQSKESGSTKKKLKHLIDEGSALFPEEYFSHWEIACNKLMDAGYGSIIPLSYARHSPKLVKPLNAQTAINFAAIVSLAAIKVNRAAAEMLSKVAVIAAHELHSVSGFITWANVIEELIRSAPESVLPVLERTQKILSILTAEQFRSWVLAGLRSTGDDTLRQIQYFSFTDPESEKWFRHEAGDIVFTDLDRRMKLYLLSLWGIQPPIRDLAPSMSPLSSRRITISNGVVQVPEVFPGFHGERAENLFRAGIAHVGAHLMFSKTKFKLGELKPIQVALVSLLEDARVEYLSMQVYPGLRKLWLPFHLAKSSGPQIVPLLLARLSRALIDEGYQDPNGWIQKGREMFYDSKNDFNDSAMCRRIGSLLGNDLGQLRAQFNAKTYVVEPPYRDDNMGLWDFGDSSGEEQDSQGIFIEATRMEKEENPDDSSPDQENQQDDEKSEQQYHARESSEKDRRESNIVVRYPEYDYLTASERPNWACVVEYFPDFGDSHKIDRILETHTDLVNRITNLIQSAKVSLPERLHRQSVGESLDLDACINATISLRMGQSPDPRIYSTTERKHRDLSVLVLLDISNSTNDQVQQAGTSVLELEIQATALLAYAMSELEDPFAISAFCSDGKEDVHYYRIKNFNSPYDDAERAYLAGLRGKLSTRMGIAMRHAAKDLIAQHTHRRLLLVISDGEPSDIDVDDKEYLVEDARKVVRSISRLGIDTFCVGLDSGGDNYLHRIFGKRNVAVIDKLDRLPERLPMLYLRLTA